MANHHTSETQVVVVMVPLPAQGHLNQLLHLSRLIASYNIPVHYVGATTHTRQTRLRAHGYDTLANIHFSEFPTPPFHTPPPDSNSKFPNHLVPSMMASLNLREPVFKLLEQLSTRSRRVIVIYDSLMAWVIQDIHRLQNAEPYCFQNTSAFSILSFYLEVLGKPIPPEAQMLNELPLLENCVSPEFEEFSKIQRESRKYNCGNIFNTCRAIEGTFLDLLAKENLSKSNKAWAIGPFNPVTIHHEKKSIRRDEFCLEWLDKQGPRSVIFVSFGTTTSLSDEQINELAIGLKQSGQPFIWVVRDADRGDIFTGDDKKAELPEGYEASIEGKGIIVRDWAPQLEILGHSSTGGFMSHCGWNSCMESITMGVPIAAWAMHTDQPRNMVLITKVLKVGLVVKDWSCGNDDELVTSTTIANSLKQLMESPEGKEVRKNAVELSNVVRESAMGGGEEMNSFISHISR